MDNKNNPNASIVTAMLNKNSSTKGLTFSSAYQKINEGELTQRANGRLIIYKRQHNQVEAETIVEYGTSLPQALKDFIAFQIGNNELELRDKIHFSAYLASYDKVSFTIGVYVPSQEDMTATDWEVVPKPIID